MNALETICHTILKRAVVTGDTLTILYDNLTKDIAAAFEKVVEDLQEDGIFVSIRLYDVETLRPMSDNPFFSIAEMLDVTTLFIMLLVKKPEENEFRSSCISYVKERGGRVGALYNTDADHFVTAFKYDPLDVQELNESILSYITPESTLRLKTPIGTNVTAIVGPYTWINQDADLSTPSKQHSLLAGEVYGCPIDVNGLLVVDGVMGAPFGIVGKDPLFIEIKNSVIVSVKSDDETLLAMFNDYLKKYPDFKKVGEWGFGTNTGLKQFTGILGIDEKFPGVHIAFGDPYPQKTGAPWSCPVHVDCVLRTVSAWIDDVQVLKNGEYLI